MRFDGAVAVLVCKSERDLGRVSASKPASRNFNFFLNHSSQLIQKTTLLTRVKCAMNLKKCGIYDFSLRKPTQRVTGKVISNNDSSMSRQ